ncbi:MAG: sulfotransferase family protein [Erythrobacter sp.]
MPQKDPLKVIYIAGYGRSGTTLLDIVLGQQPGIFAAGELTALARHVWKEREFCACRRQADECDFWGPVVSAWQEGRQPNALDEYGKTLARSEWLFDLRRLLWRFGPSKNGSAYSEATSSLLREIARASGSSVIVDSSKLPGRASALMSLKDIEVYVVHMVRDGRGVGWSMMKPYQRSVEAGIQKELKPKPLWYTAARWVSVNLGAEILRLRLPRGRSIRVRYEDFVASPETAVKSILSLVGQSYVVPDHGTDLMKPQHQIAGSRHRMQEEIRIKKDIGWTSQMPPAMRRLFSALTAPLLSRYGYFSSTPGHKNAELESERKVKEEAA